MDEGGQHEKVTGLMKVPRARHRWDELYGHHVLAGPVIEGFLYDDGSVADPVQRSGDFGSDRNLVSSISLS